MNRVLRMERIYPLGQYQNLTLMDEISGIPEDRLLDEDYLNKLRKVQILSMELQYRRYLKLQERLHQYNSEEAVAMLNEALTNTLDEIGE